MFQVCLRYVKVCFTSAQKYTCMHHLCAHACMYTCKFAHDRYLCKRSGLKYPCLPVTGQRECKLFDDLILLAPTPVNFDMMAVCVEVTHA